MPAGTSTAPSPARAWLTKATVVHAVDELERLGRDEMDALEAGLRRLRAALWPPV